jgi:hypothetical protein
MDRSALECGGRDAALAFARESQSGVGATALQNAPPGSVQRGRSMHFELS